jgi:hypothetical protein
MSENNRIRKRPSILLRFGIGLLLIIFFFAQYILFQRITGKRDLEAWIAEMRAKGEKFTLEELEPPSGPYNEKAASQLIERITRLENLKAKSPLGASAGTSAFRIVVPGKAAVWIQMDEIPPWAHDSLGESSRGWSWVELAQQIQPSLEDISAIQILLKEPRLGFRLDYHAGMNMQIPHLGKCRSLARWLASKTLMDLKQGDKLEVLQDFESFANLIRLLEEERYLISHLVQIAVGEIWQGVTWQALQLSTWSEQELIILQDLWNYEDLSKHTPTTLRVERAMGYMIFDTLAGPVGSRYGFSAMALDSLGAGAGSSTWSEDFSRRIMKTYYWLWRWAWIDKDRLLFLKKFQAILDSVEGSVPDGAWVDLQRLLTKNAFSHSGGRSEKFRFPISRTLVPSLERYLEIVARHQTARRLVPAAIALKRYHLRQACYPKQLSELVPHYLEELPKDYMDGQTLRYRRQGDGAYLLYSVGENGSDDGGDSSHPDGLTGRWHKGNLDWVWPSPATDAEIKARPKRSPRIVLPQPPDSP